MAHVFSLGAGLLKQLFLAVDLHKLTHVSYKITDFTRDHEMRQIEHGNIVLAVLTPPV